MGYALRSNSRLRGSNSSPLREEGYFAPMASVANVVDVMLVLSVGLTIAISTYWNLDFADIQEVLMQDEVTEVEDLEALSTEITEGGSAYNALGMVYEDPATGKMYMLTETDD